MGKLQNRQIQSEIRHNKRYILWGISVIVVLILAIMPILASNKAENDNPTATILSAAVEIRNLDTKIVGGGQLSSEASLNVKIPENVKLTEYLVRNGDVVSEGDAIARVDKVSVMTAITEVQATLDYLSGEIAGASYDTASTTVAALAGGTVKRIYAQTGESVQDVMLDHGALAVLSLDGLMAVKIDCSSTLEAGDTVFVAFGDGSEAEGSVKKNLDGVLTVTVEDKGYSVGEQVTVGTDAGELLGTGELYILSQWNATAYSGTVSSILVREGDTVYTGQTLFSLSETGYTAKYQQLIDQRQKYEELMLELFKMYRTETVTAPCDGIVTGVNQDGAYLLSDGSDGWVARVLACFGGKRTTGFVACAAQVQSVDDNGMELVREPDIRSVDGLEALSSIPVDCSNLTQGWRYTGDCTVYTQNDNGIFTEAGAAKPGDILLAVGDEEKICWFVVFPGCAQSPQAVQSSGVGDGISVCQLNETSDSRGIRMTGNADGFVTLLNDEPPQEEGAQIHIVTASLNAGTVGESYLSQLQASDGVTLLSGTWSAEGLPNGLTIASETGLISGIPTEAGSFTVSICFFYQDNSAVKTFSLTIASGQTPEALYYGYVAQVAEISDGVMKVMQTAYSYPITDMDHLPAVTIDTKALTEEATYFSDLISAEELAVNDYILVVVAQDGTLKYIVKQTEFPDEEHGGEAASGSGGGGNPGGMTSGGGGGASGGAGSAQAYQVYSLNQITVASVTSQEHMTVSVTIDELDITKISVGQSAVVTIDALGGEQFEAAVTGIANSGSNEGGNSKFAVELTLVKSGDMLPGMYASAVIPLETAENVACIPVAALGKEGADSVVYTSYDQETGAFGDPVIVEIGRSDEENVEILSGLAEGQVCYYAYYDTFVETKAQQKSFASGILGSLKSARR